MHRKVQKYLSINKKSTFVFDNLILNPVEFIKSKQYEYCFNINLKVGEYEAKAALKKSIGNNQEDILQKIHSQAITCYKYHKKDT